MENYEQEGEINKKIIKEVKKLKKIKLSCM